MKLEEVSQLTNLRMSILIAINAILRIVDPENCLGSVYKSRDLTDPCLRLLLSRIISYGIVVSSSFLKLPQIFNILRAGDAKGLSLTSFYLEATVLLISFIYNAKKGLPIMTYLENCTIFLEVAFMVILHWRYESKSLKHKLICLVSLAGLCMSYMIPLEFTAIFPVVIGIFSVSARLPQIIANFKQGHTGRLSVITTGVTLLGGAARLFTILQQAFDLGNVILYLVAISLNATLLGQILWYWNATAKLNEKKVV